MQRSPNLRNYRQFSVVKAPLATFDTVDLGDDDPSLHGHGSTFTHAGSGGNSDAVFPSPAITGQSHASRSQLSSSVAENGELARCDDEPETQRQPVSSADIEEHGSDHVETAVKCDSSPQETQPSTADRPKAVDNTNESESEASAKRKKTVPRIGSLKGSYIKKQDSTSSSTSSDGEDGVVVSQPQVRGRHRRFRRRELGEGECKLKFSDPGGKDTLKNLTLEYLDPKSITSPSKRKAYEKRLQRLQVKTSPIARPRSTTPINVHTLEEYVSIGSPEKSPRTEKLKITLPIDEFSAKSPRKTQSQVDSDEETSYFEFDEELLFSRTQYALVVDETGKVPPSPRKVLIPPTLSPATSRKVVTPAEDPQLDNGPGTPKLLFFKSASLHPEQSIAVASSESATSASTTEEPSWASFPTSPGNAAQGGETVTESQNWADFSAVEEPAAVAIETEEVLTVQFESSSYQRRNIALYLSSSPSPNSSDSSPATPGSVVSEPPQSNQAVEGNSLTSASQVASADANSATVAPETAITDRSQTEQLFEEEVPMPSAMVPATTMSTSGGTVPEGGGAILQPNA